MRNVLKLGEHLNYAKCINPNKIYKSIISIKDKHLLFSLPEISKCGANWVLQMKKKLYSLFIEKIVQDVTGLTYQVAMTRFG